jgi:hypothetical protein
MRDVVHGVRPSLPENCHEHNEPWLHVQLWWDSDPSRRAPLTLPGVWRGREKIDPWDKVMELFDHVGIVSSILRELLTAS